MPLYSTAFMNDPHPNDGVTGANVMVPQVTQNFDLGEVLTDNRGRRWTYVQASDSIAANGVIGVDASFTTEAGDSHKAHVAFPANYFGWVQSLDDEGDDVVLPFYALSANAADAGVITLIAPFDFAIKRIDTVLLGGALSTGDATVTTAIEGTAVTGGVVTIAQSGSAAGDKDSAVPTAANTGEAGDKITLTVGGTATGDRTINGSVLIQRA